MKITKLPNKSQLTYCNVQWFENEGGKGNAKFVLKVSYSTERDPYKAKHLRHTHRHVKFVMQSELKEITRKIRQKGTLQEAEQMKQMIIEERQSGTLVMFGYRMVQYHLPHKTDKSKTYFKRGLDPETYAIMSIRVDENGLPKPEVQIMWNGEVITTTLVSHAEIKHQNQSRYYSFVVNGPTDEELKEHLENMRNASAYKQTSEYAGSAGADEGIEDISRSDFQTEVADARATAGEGSEEGVLPCAGQGTGRENRREDTDRVAGSNGDAVAGTTGHGETSELGSDDQVSPAEYHEVPASKAGKEPGKRKGAGDYQRATEDEEYRRMVGRALGNPFAAEVDRTDRNLGTDICLFRGI